MQDEDRVPLDVRVRRLNDAVLEIDLEGVRADGESCRRCQEIKAVTYHNLEIQETPEGLETVVVLDV
jgi:SHS2 domain-containing protein